MNKVDFLIKLLNEILYTIGDGSPQFSNYMLEGLWFSLLNIDRELFKEDDILMVGNSVKRISIITLDGESKELTLKEIDEMIELKIYHLRDMIFNSKKAFNDSMILLDESLIEIKE